MKILHPFNTSCIAKHLLFSLVFIFSCCISQAQSPLAYQPASEQIMDNKKSAENKIGKEKISNSLGKLPLIFRKNQGQWDEKILFRGSSDGSNVSFMKNRLSFCSAREKEEEHEEEHEDEHYEESEEYEYMVWNLHFVGVNINAHIEATGEENSRTNYITGNDPARWAVDVPDYRLIRYKNIYENIDLHYYGESGYQLKYDYIIKPGGKVEDIIMELEGIQNLKINEKGELEITTPWGVLLEKAPFSYQNTKNGICKIDVRYRIINNKAFGFSVNEQYDKSRNLIVDPVTMVWCTYAGATGNSSSNYSHDITVDNSRNVYITGKCDNTYPTTAGVYDASQNGNLDIFVTKFNPNASAMIYSTYIGGSGNDEGNAIKVNATGEVYVTGKTQSTNFPVAGAYQSSNGGGVDCFLAKLSSTGTALLFSTYLGGSAEDNGKDLVLDGSGQIFITGSTSSSDFPVTGGAFQTTNAAGFGLSAFVTRLNATASGLIYSTYLGGSFLFGMGNIGRAIAVNSAGEAYIAGSTASSSFPVTVGAFQTVSGGSDDGFITKLNSTGTGLIYSTYLGGSEMDIAAGLALNSAGNVYVTGSTGSSNFPVTPGAYQTTGSSNAFISKLNTTGSSLVYSTYIGGSASDGAEDIAVNSNGEAYIIGSSGSIEVTTGAFDITANGLKDFFISKISADGDSLMCSSYIGGNSNDYFVPHLYLDASGSVDTVYANGTSHSTNFPTTAGVYQPTKINGSSGSDQPVVYKMVACANEPVALTVTTSTTNVNCNGGNNGSATIIPSGGTSPYTYSWSTIPAQTTATATGLSAGNFTVTVTDASSNTTTSAVTITQPAVLTATITSQTNVSCNGGNNGTINFTPSGGTSPYTFLWSNGSTTEDISSLAAGTYTVTVTDNKSCTKTASATITQPAAALATSTSGNNVSCNGGGNGSINLTPSGGTSPYTFSWSNGATTEDISGLSAGTYTVTVTDNKSCTKTTSVTITQPAAALAASITSSNVSCNGASTGSATVTPGEGTSPYTYLWSNGASTGSATGLSAGTYTVTVTDNNSCIKTSSVTISQPASPLAASISGTNVNCNGASTGSATVSPSGGTSPYTFLWSNGVSASSATGLSAGTYTVTVTDNNSCTKTASVTITQPVSALAAVISGTNVNCNGASTGSATVSPSGGTSPYTFLWSTGASGSSASGLSAGTYNVTVTDNNACTKAASVTISQPADLVVSVSVTNASCGSLNGEATADPSGGNSGYTYLWSNGQTSQTATGLTAGTNSVTVTDANGCTETASAVISNPVPAISITDSSMVSCNGASTGSATVSPSGGTTPYTYQWSNGQTDSTATGLSAGTFFVTVEDALGCNAVLDIDITQPAAIAISSSVTNVSCNGASTGSATATPSGGTSPYTFLWSNGASGASSSGLSAGTYTVTVTDDNSCTKTSAISVSQPSVLNAGITGIDVSCNGDSTGSATVTPSGGTSPYAYAWSNGASGASAPGLSAGTYTVTVTDNNSCTKISSVTVSQPASPLAASISGTNVNCNGASTGSATVTPGGGTSPYTFSWSNGAATEDINSLQAGTYSVTVTDNNGCTQTASVAITEPATVVSASITGTNVSCYGASTGSATAAPSGGTSPYTYLWSNGASSATASGLSAGIYIVTVTDFNGCTKAASVTINQPANPLGAIVSGTSVSCNGGSDGSVDLSPSGGTAPYSFLWSNSATAEDLSGVASGTYTVTVTDNNSCTQSASIVISQPSALSASVTTTNVNCNGSSTGSAIVAPAGGSTPYSYLWSNGAAAAGINNIPGGVYFVTVTDNNGCLTTTSATVAQPAALSVFASATDATCGNADGNACIDSVNGGVSPYTYLWSNGSGAFCTGQVASGSFTFTVTDNNSCTKSSTVSVSDLDGPSASIASITNLSCNGDSTGSATIAVSGGLSPYSFLWSNGETDSTATVLSAGAHSVTVSDANSCVANSIVTISEPSVLTSSITGFNVNCFGGNDGAANLTVSGGTPGYTFSWSNGASGASAPGLSAGTYTVTVTDNNSCTTTDSVTITQPASALAASITGTDVSCNGASTGSATVNPSGGTSPYTFLWSNGASGASAPGLSAGNYSVTVTDANSCAFVTSVIVNEPSDLTAGVSVNNASCGNANGSASLTVNGGTSSYSYLWSDGQATSSATGLDAGVYYVTVTDANGCTQTDTALVSNPVPSVSFTDSAMVSCNGASTGSATVTPAGGTPPYTYNWSNGQTDSTATGLAAGSYIVTVQDDIGCTAFLSINITESTGLSVTDSITNISCNGGNNGAINISVSGGTPPFNYQWSNAATSEDISGLAAGNYSVTISDNSGCSSFQDYYTTEPTSLSASSSSTQVNCFGDSTGSVLVSVIGGTAPYSYLWSNGASTSSATGLSAGTYTVTATDINGCSISSSATINQPANAVNSFISGTNVNCFGNNTGAASAVVSGGTAPYSYLWNIGATVQNLSALLAGNYIVTATDNNGCTSISSVVITQPSSPLSSSASAANVSCSGASTGSADAAASGGASPYNFLWSNGASSASVPGLSAGNYSVTVTDANNCTSISSVTISEPADLTTNVNMNNASCGNSNGGASVSASGGTTAYSYFWSDGQTSANATGLDAGVYYVTVTDANGCTETDTALISNPVPSASFTASSMVNCNGASTGSATITPTGGTTPYLYNWSNGQTDSTATGLSAGNYIVTVQDDIGCTALLSISIIEPAALSVSDSVTDASCNGGNNGAINITASGGTSPYNYQWSNAANTEDISGLAAGNFSLTITDNNSCSLVQNYSVSNPSALNSSAGTTDVSCNGDSTGSATITTTGGSSPYSYLWTNGAASASVSGLAAGNYSVTSSDLNGCTVVTNVTINQPAPLLVSTSDNFSTCGNADGQSIANAAGGTFPYSFQWSDGSASASLSDLPAGNYIVTITDANGCSDTAIASVYNVGGPFASASVTDPQCNGGANGQAVVTATGDGPFAYQWSDGQTGATATGLSAGTYYVTVSDTVGCTYNAVALVGQPAIISTSIAASICAGESILLQGAFQNAAGVYKDTLSASNGCDSIVVTTLTIKTVSVVQLAAYICSEDSMYLVGAYQNISGNYYDTLMAANGCDSILITTLIVYPPVYSNASAEICSGDSLFLQGAYQDTSGNYYDTLTAVSGCDSIVITNLTVHPLPVLSFTSSDVLCNGASTGSATVTASGGTSPYSFLWSNGASSASAPGLSAGIYTITISDGYSCTTSGSIIISEPGAIAVTTASTQDNCGASQGTATAIPSGGNPPYSYLWDNGQNTATATGLIPGNYTITVTDSTGCAKSSAVSVSDTGSVSAAISPAGNAICSGDSMVLNASGGDQFTWSNGDTSSSVIVSPSASTLFMVTVSEGTSCSDVDSVFVTVNPLPAALVSGDSILCLGESSLLTVTGNGTFSWSTGQSSSEISVNPATNTVYMVTVTNSCGSVSDTLNVTVNTLPVADAGNDTTVIQESTVTLTASGGTSYLWSTTQTGSVITVNPEETTAYYVTVTDASGCSSQDSVVVSIDFKQVIFVPSMFAPNGNGKNDVVYVRGLGIKALYFAIYDRWGEKVFETTDQNFGWDGKFKGQDMNSAVFVYILNATMADGSLVEQKGNITLVR